MFLHLYYKIYHNYTLAVPQDIYVCHTAAVTVGNVMYQMSDWLTVVDFLAVGGQTYQRWRWWHLDTWPF